MIDTVLFDLDDTLLGNNLDTFLPTYFGLLTKYATPTIDPRSLMQALQAGTQAMIQNKDTAVTNHDVFWAVFQQKTGLDPVKIEPFFNRFYENEFNQLQPITSQRPAAIELIKACFTQFDKVIIATNPMFPTAAIEARLRWAGVPTTEFDFTLVTDYNNMHATKPNTAYYREILERVGSIPRNSIMVGDDWENDIKPAATLGLATYWIVTPGNKAPDETLVTACGSLDNLTALVTNGQLQSLTI